MSKINYVPLHVHTSRNSIGDAILKLDEYINKAKELNMKSLCITGHGSLADMYDFYFKCNENDIQPIIGCCLPDQIIYTNKGPKEIKDIKPGDMVLTHKGRYRKVLNHWSKSFEGTLYGLNCWTNNIVWLTDEHPVLINHINQNKGKKNITQGNCKN